ncbi:MAG: OmpA family protein [Myxococcales bacterium]|jgi:outer membrane protein OmpA-like peptidoglycan-associated protein
MGRWATASLAVVIALSLGGSMARGDEGDDEEPVLGSLGTKDPGLFNMKGAIYLLPVEVTGMPEDIEKQKPVGYIYTDKLDIPAREFDRGFPGVTDRYEWFGLIYSGVFQIEKPGKYRWILTSDDGSRLWIDGKEVINNDGQHGEERKEAVTELAKGSHTIKVWYFQGPAYEIALQLYIQPPGEKARPFRLPDYAADLSTALKKVHAEATADGIKIKLDSAILFDTAKWDLKPSAIEAIDAVAQVIRAYPGCSVRIEGHTDSVGSDADNQKLSEKRADSVKGALIAKQITASMESKGFGETKPAASNADEKGRALNRRVEIFVKP